MKETLITGLDSKGERLDIYLAARLKGRLSRNQIKRLIGRGSVLVDGEVKKAHYILRDRHTIEFFLDQPTLATIQSEDIPLDIVYEDADILVVNKPTGMVVHPACGNPSHTLVNAAMFYTKGKLSQKQTSKRPGIVHRLDKDVSGIMVIAKTDTAYNGLIKQFQERSIRRKYIAFVKGIMPQEEGIIELPIGRATRDRKKMAVRFFNSKNAVTRYKVIKKFSHHTKLQLNIETGRTHQIRVHMAHVGFPIIGDTKYGDTKFKRIALYAAELDFIHPVTGKPLHFCVSMPEELKALEF